MTREFATADVDPVALRNRLAVLYDCDPQRGTFTRKQRMRGNRVGAVAGGSSVAGYRVIRVDGRIYQLHRLIWLWVHGEWPEHMIDHINGDPSDNRAENLREASPAINSQNRRSPPSDKRSGLPIGVTQQLGRTRWRAMIRHPGMGKNISLGYYDSPEMAHAAYVAAKRELHEGNTL